PVFAMQPFTFHRFGGLKKCRSKKGNRVTRRASPKGPETGQRSLRRTSSSDRLVNNSKRSFGEILSRASLGDVLRVARKASRSVRLTCALGRQRDALTARPKLS